jgi:hypothetical protein
MNDLAGSCTILGWTPCFSINDTLVCLASCKRIFLKAFSGGGNMDILNNR